MNFLSKNNNQNKGITLIALVVTIVVLLVLAGVSLNLVIGNNGLIKKAQEAKDKYQEASINTEKDFDQLYGEVSNMLGEYNKTAGVNIPNLKTGMMPIKFTEATASAKGTVVTTTTNDTTWYNYKDKHWANAQTKDGSMWVWIPRFAYRLHRDNNGNLDNKTFDVVFLIGTTDTYYDKDGNIQRNVKRATADFTPDTTSAEYYTVHPAFTNEKSINYKNGGWDSELTGIWVAKFEAGYPTGGNTVPVKASSVKYTQNTVWAALKETGTSDYVSVPARNWLDGIYGSNATSIKYPTFQGNSYSMNYINEGDAYSISKVLTESGNIYGLSSDSDSHLMKNSEWGACAYLAQSAYGLNGTDISVNSVNKNSGGSSTTKEDGNALASIYAVTGYNANGNEWNDYLGSNKSASTTGNIYGIYDFSGGLWERTAAYIANGNVKLSWGESFTKDSKGNYITTSTKYATVYPYAIDSTTNEEYSNYDTACQKNWEKNRDETQIYGDAVRETSQRGIYSNYDNYYYTDSSRFLARGSEFFIRGGRWDQEPYAGLFAYNCGDGTPGYLAGFRAVLV